MSTYLVIYSSDFRYNSWWSCAINSNCSSSSATIRAVLWSGSAYTVSYSSGCSRISTRRSTQAAWGKNRRRKCKTVHPVELACRFWMIMTAGCTTACLRMPQSTTRSTTAVTATARTTVMSLTITSRRKNSLRTHGKIEHFFRCADQPLILSDLQLPFVYREKSFRFMSTNLGVRTRSQIIRMYKEDKETRCKNWRI